MHDLLDQHRALQEVGESASRVSVPTTGPLAYKLEGKLQALRHMILLPASKDNHLPGGAGISMLSEAPIERIEENEANNNTHSTSNALDDQDVIPTNRYTI